MALQAIPLEHKLGRVAKHRLPIHIGHRVVLGCDTFLEASERFGFELVRDVGT